MKTETESPELEQQLGKPVHLAHGGVEWGWPTEHTYCGAPVKGRASSPGPSAAITCTDCVVVAESRRCPQCGRGAGFPL